VLKAARRDRSSFTVRVPVARREIELHRPELLALAAELRQAPAVTPRCCVPGTGSDGGSQIGWS
jgi:hypothetical protein